MSQNVNIIGVYEKLNQVTSVMFEELTKSDRYSFGTIASLFGVGGDSKNWVPDQKGILGHGMTDFEKKTLNTYAPLVFPYDNEKISSGKVLLPGGTDVGPAAKFSHEGILTGKLGWWCYAEGISIDKFVFDAAMASGNADILIDPLAISLKRAMSASVEKISTAILAGAPSNPNEVVADDLTGVRSWISDRNTICGVDRTTSAGVGFRAQYSTAALPLSLDLFDKLDLEGVATNGGPDTTTRPLIQIPSGDRYTFLGAGAFNALKQEILAKGLTINYNAAIPDKGMFGMKQQSFVYGKRVFTVAPELATNELIEMDRSTWQLRYEMLMKPTKITGLSEEFRGAGLALSKTGALDTKCQLYCSFAPSNVRLTNLTF